MTDTAEAGAGVEAAGGDVAESGAPLPVAEDEARVMVGAGLLAESGTVVVRTDEVEPGFGEVEQAFSSLGQHRGANSCLISRGDCLGTRSSKILRMHKSCTILGWGGVSRGRKK